jgi:hypothetical protein
MGGCFAAGLFCIVFPWYIRNVVVLNDSIMVSVGSGSVFLQGSDDKCLTIEGKNSSYLSMYGDAMEAGWISEPNGKESDSDRRQLLVGLHNYWVRIKNRPFSMAPFLLHKVIRLWYGTESGGFAQQLALGMLSLLIVPAAIWQIGRWWRSGRSEALVIASLLGYFVVLHWITLPEYRYMHPVFPLLILAACQAFVNCVEKRHDVTGIICAKT